MFSDLRYALRSLSKSPGFTAVVILSFALGIGANATTLCWLRGMLYNALPAVPRQSEMVVLKSNNGGGNINALDCADFASLKEVFVGGEVSQLGPIFLEEETNSTWAFSQVCSANFFDLLEVRPVLGRGFLPGEDKSFGGSPVLVISHAFWKHHYNADPGVIGRKVQVNRQPFTIIGVAPEGFVGTMTGVTIDCWAPLSMAGVFFKYDRSFNEQRFARCYHTLFRLQPGVTLRQAQAAVDIRNAQLAKEYPQSNEGATHEVLPLSRAPYGAQSLLLTPLKLLLCISLLVLLIVSSNVANLLLSRAVRRSKEIAIRLATGASRWQLIRLFMTESLLLALVGGLLGLVMSSWMVNLIGSLVPPTDLPTSILQFEQDPMTILLISLLTLVTGCVVGLVPALQFAQSHLAPALKDGGRSSAGTAHHRVRKILVVAEITLSIVLLICAGLCIKGFRKASTVNPGFDTKHALLIRMSIGYHGYDEARGIEYYARLQEHLAAQPGVKSASLGSWFPMGFDGCKGCDATPEGRIRPKDEDPTYCRTIVGTGYFDTMGIRLLEGRDFRAADDRQAPDVVIVNEALARRFWPGQNPLGRTFRSLGRTRTVIGVVANVCQTRIGETPFPHLYFPYRQGVPELDLSAVVRVEGDPKAAAAALRKAFAEVDPAVNIRKTTTLEEHASAALFPSLVASSMVTLLGIVALGLAAMGIYAVMAYSVSQRISEFGIRMALGAGRRDIVGLVLGQGLGLVGLGVSLGIVLALFVSRLMSDFLFGVSPFDLLTFLGVPALLCLVALGACLLPALRATQVDPMEALRSE
jgi:predicted permease